MMSKIKNALKRFVYKPDQNDAGDVIEPTEALAPPPGKQLSTFEQIRDRFGTLNAAEALVVKAVIENRPVEKLRFLMCIRIDDDVFYVARDDGELSTLGTNKLGFVRRKIVRWLEDGPNVVDGVNERKNNALRIMQEYLQAPIKIK